MNQDVYNEILDMLNKAKNHVHDCEYWNGGDDGIKARILIGKAINKIQKLKKESEKQP